MPKIVRARGGHWNDTGPIMVCHECECEFRTEIEPGLSTHRIFCAVCDAAFTRSEQAYAAELDGIAHSAIRRRLVTPAQRVAEEAAKDIIRREQFAAIERQLKDEQNT